MREPFPPPDRSIADRFFHVYSLHDGKIVRKVEFTQRSEALEAVGLSDQDGHVDSA